MLLRMSVVFACACFVLSPSVFADGKGHGRKGRGKTVFVDCNRGESINAALRSKANELTIEIRGICDEDVVVRRDNVTLRGSDPDLDGLRGVGAGDQAGEGVLEIRNAWNVRAENLTVREGKRHGIAVHFSNRVEIHNCRLVDNSRFGLINSESVSFVTDTTTLGRSGLGGFDAGTLMCTGCTIDASGVGVYGSDSFIVLEESSVTAFRGVEGNGSRVQLYNTNVTATERALYAWGSSWSDIRSSNLQGSAYAVMTGVGAVTDILDSQLDGPVFVGREGYLLFWNGSQIANSGENYLEHGGSLDLRGGGTLLGTLRIDSFAHAFIHVGQVNGNLICERGGDAVCDDPNAVTGTSNCSYCLKP